jgi:NADH dehydrogenase FAD-containing subunit
VSPALPRAPRRLVLAGAGHAHLYVAAHGRALVDAGIQVTLIDPGVFWYSGMATGMLGGAYDRAEDVVDARRLVEIGGGSFVQGHVVGVDRAARVVRVDDGGVFEYDALSFDVGSEVAVDFPMTGAIEALTAKPISNLWRLRTELERRFARGVEPRVVVIGGGATGCEIAANVDGLARRCRARAHTTLLSRSGRLLAGHRRAVGRSLGASFAARGIQVVCGCSVVRVDDGVVVGSEDRRFPCELIVVATGLRPPARLAAMGLPVAADGGLAVTAALQSSVAPCLFGAGDCVTIAGHRLPKLGVFGVRAAPTLLHNLRSFLLGGPTRRYRPQKRYLSILDLGDETALATWSGLYCRGRGSRALKGAIDRRFVNRYRRRYT